VCHELKKFGNHWSRYCVSGIRVSLIGYHCFLATYKWLFALEQVENVVFFFFRFDTFDPANVCGRLLQQYPV